MRKKAVIKHLILFFISIASLAAVFFAISKPIPNMNLFRPDDTIYPIPEGKGIHPILEVGLFAGVILVSFGIVELIFFFTCRIINRCRKPEITVADNKTFVTLIRVAQEDTNVRQKLLAILSLDSFNRKSALNSFINEMLLQKAPKDFIAAIANLLDDAIAEKALEVIRET